MQDDCWEGMEREEKKRLFFPPPPPPHLSSDPPTWWQFIPLPDLPLLQKFKIAAKRPKKDILSM